MDEDESIQSTPSSVDRTPASNSPYNLLLRQSRKMGSIATRGIDVTKEFLKKDVKTISPLNPDSILFNSSLSQKLRNNEGITAKEAKAINRVVQRSHEILAGAKTVVMPQNLFPDSIIVDRTKVSINKRTFFWNLQVITTRIEDILGVTSNCGPFFVSLTISTRVMNSTDHYEISFFLKKDAVYLKQIIQGYVIAQHNAIETKHLSKNELIETLLELGRDSSM